MLATVSQAELQQLSHLAFLYGFRTPKIAKSLLLVPTETSNFRIKPG